MALKGSLEDFSIVNILQMIKLEGKIGKLLLNDGSEEVKITFDKGMIIYAEGTPSKDEARIEYTLLSNGFIKSADWEAIKKEHSDKLKPYWDLLSKSVEPNILLELINRQTVDTVYYGLRWVKGTYEFTPVKNLRYNNKVMRPMDVDGILMEGCRIADEWTRVSASIPSFDTTIVKNILGDEEKHDGSKDKKDEEPKDFKNSLEFDVLSARGITLKESQISVLAVIGSGKTIQEIMNSARQGSFTTLEALHALLTMGVIKATKKKGKAMMQVDQSGAALSMAVAAGLAALIAFGVYQNYLTTGGAEIQKENAAIVRQESARHGLLKVERALRVYITLYDKTPKNVDALVKSGVLSKEDSIDPWDNQYMLEIDKESYSIYSKGPDIGLLTDNIYLAYPS